MTPVYAAYRRLYGSVPSRALFTLIYIIMRFRIPGKDINVRLFERVQTVDSQYDIFDVGVEQADGTIDSVVIGGSFSYAKSLVQAIDQKAEEKRVSDAKASSVTASPASAPEPDLAVAA